MIDMKGVTVYCQHYGNYKMKLHLSLLFIILN